VSQIEYINRQNSETIVEEVPGGKMMTWLYNKPFGKLSLWILIKRKLFSAIGGKYMDSSRSQKRVAPFVEKYGINLSEYIIPENGFKSFNQFFYRKVKPEYRKIENGAVSPADGRVLAFQSMNDVPEFFVKGSAFDLTSFLNDAELATKYAKGAMLIIRLAPVDYHRYHFPVSGEVGENIKISGAYYSVSPIALAKKLEIFCQNKREYSIVTSESNGDVLICDVGATLTGSIIQTHIPNSKVSKGDEKGYFAFGGSTIVVLFEKNKIKFSADLVENTQNHKETWLKMGEQIGE
jgi:phosphatidylserine decarboxylase